MCSSPITQMRRSRIGAWESSLHREPHTLRRGDVGAEIIHELKPHDSDHHIVKKGFGGIANAALNITPRNMGVTTCAIVGLTTCVCVSNTVRGGVEHNYRMILVSDAVAEVSRDTHDAELKTMSRIFADVKTTDEVIALLATIRS